MRFAKGAHTALLDLEAMARSARSQLEAGEEDTDSPEP